MVVKDNSEASDASDSSDDSDTSDDSDFSDTSDDSDKKSGAPGALRLCIGDIRFLLITSRDSGEESDPCRCRG